MFKFLALVVILAVVAVHAYPAAEEETKPQGALVAAAKPDEADLEAGEGSDLKPAETFGFGYYPTVRLGYGGGGYGHGGWGYSGGYGHWGGYRRGWGYSGYPNGYYW